MIVVACVLTVNHDIMENPDHILHAHVISPSEIETKDKLLATISDLVYEMGQFI